LGGEDFDNVLVDYCVEKFASENSIDISSDAGAMRTLRQKCEIAKRVLSTELESVICCEYSTDGADFKILLTREKFENLCENLFEMCIELVRRVLIDAKVTA